MNKAVLLAAALSLSTAASAQEASWLRYPSISPDGKTIAFTYRGDIYTVPSTGGEARALTLHEAHDVMPVWSRDGKTIAFASDRHGNFDVFVIPSEGGTATRLTFHSAGEMPYTFTPDGKSVLFGAARQDDATHRQYPTGSQPEVYSVPVTGGRVQQFWTVPAEYLTFSKDGKSILYHDKKGGENEWRKHHVSSIARDIWLYDADKNEHRQLTQWGAENRNPEDRNPVFAGAGDKMFYYLSEESGTFNVHSAFVQNPAISSQLTDFKLHPVRFLSVADNGLMAFSWDGGLYTFNPADKPVKLSVTIRGDAKSNNETLVQVSGNVREMAVSPNGKEVAYIVRGEVFVSSIEGGVTKRITKTPEQERFLSFTPSGDGIVYASQRSGTWKIYQTKKARTEEPYFYASTLLTEEVLISGEKDAYQPQISPDGKEIAYIEDRRSLKIFNLASKQSRQLLGPDKLFYQSDGDQYFRWSPDGKWIVAEYSPVMVHTDIVLIPSDGKGALLNLTESGYTDGRPVFVNDGKQVLFASDRDGLRSYANSGRRQADVYSIFLTKDAWDRFRLSKEDYALLKEIEEKAKKKDEKKDDKADPKKKAPEVKKDSTLVLDLDGVQDRKERLTIHSSSLGDAVLSKDNEKLFYLARFEKGLNLWSTNLRTKETKMELALDANSASLEWDKEKKSLFVLADGRIIKVNPEGWKRENVSIAGEMTLDAHAERVVMFNHVWRRAKGLFYTSSMHGAPWDKLKGEYEKHLPHVSNGHEFAELLSEMLGELNVSHSGARINATKPDGDRTASLGIFADYSHSGDGVKIAEILKGGPLDKAAFNLKPGAIIEQIDGETISASRDWYAYLNRKADKYTLLTVFDPATKARTQITVKPVSMGEENALLYRRWVEKNQADVDKLSNGKLGYVHIPGMGDGPYRVIYEEMMGKYHDRDGIVVDTRFNSGGDLVSDLAMFFTGKKYLTYGVETRDVGYEPTFRWTKPTVALFNEANYSDGHCFACGYTDLGIGKTIGMPVPGTCSFASWEGLQDGVTTWGAVPISTRDNKGRWLENVQTDPEVMVKNEVDKITKGIDQQLERAVKELQDVVKNQK
jgi:Tol biopolymer transport system component/C-terminal processing protease CtpA/Prc